MKSHILTLCLLLTAAAVYLCCGIGLGAWESPLTMDETVRQIHLPCIYTALSVGAGLSASGAALQVLFENPLADPSLVGTPGGMALGVIVLLALGGGAMGVPTAVFPGALGVCLLILAVHKLPGGGTLGLLVLGSVLSAFSDVMVSMILLLSDDLVLRSVTTWPSGGLAEADSSSPVAVIAAMLPGFLILPSTGRRLDVLMTGEDIAAGVGASVEALRVQTVVGAASMMGIAVSLSGIIGSLGMMIPNVLARTVDGNRRKLIALSAWLGAVFLMVVDGAVRWLTYPIDLPVGIVTALLDGPFFMYLLIKLLKSR